MNLPYLPRVGIPGELVPLAVVPLLHADHAGVTCLPSRVHLVPARGEGNHRFTARVEVVDVGGGDSYKCLPAYEI